MEDKVSQMETKLATVKNQMNNLLAYIASRKDVPEHLLQWQLIWFMHPSMRY